MAKNGKSTKRAKPKMTLPILPILAIGSVMFEPGMKLVSGDYKGAFGQTCDNFLGVNKKWTYTQLGIGIGGHILASKLGANRAIANAHIPVFRL